MKVTIYGAAGEVTGSCYLVETGNARILVDCGMFQGSPKIESLNRIPAEITARPLDAVVLTHGHLDHCGRLPLLYKSKFSGPTYATAASIDVTRLILSDAAKLQQQDIERTNRLRRRAGKLPVQGIYDIDDVLHACSKMQSLKYNTWQEIADGINIQLVEAGHILGSSCVEMTVNQNGGRGRLVFSGDLGPFNAPVMRDPAVIEYADTVFMESTYGDRDHRSLTDTVAEFEDLIRQTVEKRGKIIIPTFAVGRAQEILFHLAEIFRSSRVKPFPIYLDSPMATAATGLYQKYQTLLDEEAGILRDLNIGSIVHCTTAEESRELNYIEGPCVILAGSGMCNGGRILHHLRHNLWNANNVIMIVGYQVKGTLGRLLLEGYPTVKIFGETIAVNATVRGLGGFSAHAGQTDLLRWLEPMVRDRLRVIITHGEDYARNQLALKINEQFKIEAEIPGMSDVLNI